MSSFILELVIYELKKVFNKNIIAGGQTTVHSLFNQALKISNYFFKTGLCLSIFFLGIGSEFLDCVCRLIWA
jgi:hypothetical protein